MELGNWAIMGPVMLSSEDGAIAVMAGVGCAGWVTFGPGEAFGHCFCAVFPR